MDTLELDALAERIAHTAAGIDAATHRLLADIRRFDEVNGWLAQGAVSCAHWLSWKCGIALGAAREKVRVAHALAALPLIDDELRHGRLSFSKVRALTRVATPDNEPKLVELGRESTAAQLEKICRLLDPQRPRAAADQERRWLRARDVAGGMVRIEAQLRPDEAARVLAACDVLAGSAAARVDALLTMAEATLRGDQPDRPPVEIMVHVDAATLNGAQGDTALSAETSRRLLCDAGIVPVLDDDQGQPLSVGRKHRVFAGALRRALLARDRTCRYPGCTHARYLHGHHVRHWIDGGETSIANGTLLCTYHHRLVHEGGFRIVSDDLGLHFLGPDGRDVCASPAPAPATPVAPLSRLPPTWSGDPVDDNATLGWLMA